MEKLSGKIFCFESPCKRCLGVIFMGNIMLPDNEKCANWCVARECKFYYRYINFFMRSIQCCFDSISRLFLPHVNVFFTAWLDNLCLFASFTCLD